MRSLNIIIVIDSYVARYYCLIRRVYAFFNYRYFKLDEPPTKFNNFTSYYVVIRRQTPNG